MKIEHVTHDSIPIFIDDKSTVLILGSLPSVKTREVGFYYGHPRNRFYLVLSKIFSEEVHICIEEKKSFLSKHHIALYDVIYECNIVGSADSSIKNPKVIDIKDILTKYPNIKRIAINGGKAKSLFDKSLLPIVNTFNIEIFYLPSTSPANAKTSIDVLVKEYSKVFY